MKPHVEKKPLPFRLTNNSVLKAMSLSPTLAKLHRHDVAAWLKNALAWGDPIAAEKLAPETQGFLVLLPAEHKTDIGERLVALTTEDNGARVVTTIVPHRFATRKPAHLVQKLPIPASLVEGIRAAKVDGPKLVPLSRMDGSTTFLIEKSTEAPPTVSLQPVHPAPAPTEIDADPRPDNRGAQLARMELARRRAVHQDVAASAGVTPGEFSKVINGAQDPSIRLALALERELGVPAAAWLEAA